jgi:hypothetical protein
MHGPINKTGKFSAADGRAGNALVCEHCNKPLRSKRGSRRQRYCNNRCRQAASRVRKWTSEFGLARPSGYQDPGVSRSVENPPLISITCQGDFADRASPTATLRDATQVEIIGAHSWRTVVSPSGVTCEVARFRGPIRQLVVPSSWEPAWSPTWRDQVDLPIPYFLRRTVGDA